VVLASAQPVAVSTMPMPRQPAAGPTQRSVAATTSALLLLLQSAVPGHASVAIADDDCFALDVSLLQLDETPAHPAEQLRRGAAAAVARRPANTSIASWPSDVAKPAMMAKMYGPLAEYITAFGVIDSASNTVDRVFTHGEKGRGKWGYGYCVCEICHTVVETLQLKMFQDYGIGFQEQDVYDVIEDSFCDSFLPFYRSGCQWILSYKYSAVTPMLLFMAPYDICMMERMCFGSPGGARAGQQTSVMDVMGMGSSKMGTGAGSKLS
jgi:hypothetical protein